MPRIFAPLLPADLDELAAGRSVTVAGWTAAPDGLSGDDLEEAEYDALVAAAGLASDLVGDGARRVVVAADVAAAAEGASLHVGPRQVASFHVDETTEHSDEDLLWYDASELAEVTRLARAS